MWAKILAWAIRYGGKVLKWVYANKGLILKWISWAWTFVEIIWEIVHRAFGG
jgi:hypothetical protein